MGPEAAAGKVSYATSPHEKFTESSSENFGENYFKHHLLKTSLQVLPFSKRCFKM